MALIIDRWGDRAVPSFPFVGLCKDNQDLGYEEPATLAQRVHWEVDTACGWLPPTDQSRHQQPVCYKEGKKPTVVVALIMPK